MFGKLIDGILIPAPNPMKVGDVTYYNPSNMRYIDAGYLEIVDTPYPEVGEDNPDVIYSEGYIEEGGKIVKVWIEVEPPPQIAPGPTTDEKLAELAARVAEAEQGVIDNAMAICEVYELVEGGAVDG